MKTDVLFEKKDNRLVITLDKDADYGAIKAKLAQVLGMSSDTFTGVKGTILVRGRRLLDDEENEIRNMISEKTNLDIKIEKPKQMGLATIDNIFNKDTTISVTKVVRGTIRSGQRIEFEGSVIILGDVNGGAEVIAEGNIVVLGTLRGFAHAGAKGNRSAFVAAEAIKPTQLRIADVIMKHEIVKHDMEYGYEIASIKMGEIVVEM
ncbi:MAG: septum site-determining protein MinC [Clostridia bacterium]|nr:septum site-determining protein MinC [Clostridia bacterium]